MIITIFLRKNYLLSTYNNRVTPSCFSSCTNEYSINLRLSSKLCSVLYNFYATSPTGMLALSAKTSIFGQSLMG